MLEGLRVCGLKPSGLGFWVQSSPNALVDLMSTAKPAYLQLTTILRVLEITVPFGGALKTAYEE